TSSSNAPRLSPAVADGGPEEVVVGLPVLVATLTPRRPGRAVIETTGVVIEAVVGEAGREAARPAVAVAIRRGRSCVPVVALQAMRIRFVLLTRVRVAAEVPDVVFVALLVRDLAPAVARNEALHLARKLG